MSHTNQTTLQTAPGGNASTPLRLKRKRSQDDSHKYCIEIDNIYVDILYKGKHLSDDLFPGWAPFLALKVDNTDAVTLYQAEKAGGLVEWSLKRTGSGFAYTHHRFVDRILPGEIPPTTPHSEPKHYSLSLDIEDILWIRHLTYLEFIINHDWLISSICHPSTSLLLDDQNLIRDSRNDQTPTCLSKQVRRAIGPQIHECLDSSFSSFGGNTNSNGSHLKQVFATCYKRWESKNKLLRTLANNRLGSDSDSCSNSYQYKHIFSYAPGDRTCVCNCINVASPASSTLSTAYLIESGEAGLISGAYVSSLDSLIISPHPKNGITDHASAAARIAASVSHFIKDSSLHLESKGPKEPNCNLLALTNAGNLYHLAANDLYGVFACCDFWLKSSLQPSISLGKGHSLLPVNIPATYFGNSADTAGTHLSYRALGDIVRYVNIADGPHIATDILTLAKAPYYLDLAPLSLYKNLVEAVAKASSSLSQMDLASCTLKSTAKPFIKPEASIIVFGIRCARRKPVNQLEMLETVLRCADLSGKETIVIIEGTYSLSGSDSEASFIAEEEHFLEKASPVLLSCGESVQVFSFIGKSAEYSTCSAFIDAIIIAPWGAGLTRHMFFAAKSYLLHTNCSNRNGMTNDYYSWEIPYTPKKVSYLANQGEDFNCAANEEVVRLDPLRPDWAIFNDYSVDVVNLSEELTQILAT